MIDSFYIFYQITESRLEFLKKFGTLSEKY